MGTDEFAGWFTHLWEQRYLGIAVGRLVVAAFILAVALLLRRPFGALLLRVVLKRTKDEGSAFTDALAPATRLVLVVIAVFVISEFIIDNARTRELCLDINRSLAAFALFWAAYEASTPLVKKLAEKNGAFGDGTTGWMTRVAKILLMIIGAASILEIWGIRVGAVIAGLGLAGAAVALGAQDLFKNLIAGIFIIAERRFQSGDWIRADGVVEGTVEVVGLRTTRVRRFDLAPVFVPNSRLADNAVTNFSQMTHRQISWCVGLVYRTNVAQLRQIRDEIEAYILGGAEFAQTPETQPIVRIDNFGASSINVLVSCFTLTTDSGEWLKVKEALAYAIKTIVAAAGSDFAFASQSLYLEKLPEGTEFFPARRVGDSTEQPSGVPEAKR